MIQALRQLILGTILLAVLPCALPAFNITLSGWPASLNLPAEKPDLHRALPPAGGLKGNQAKAIPTGLDHAFPVSIPFPEIPPEKTRRNYRIKTIVIDAGHGGHDPGCLGQGSREKHLALAIALKAAEAIRSDHPDIEVILTRDRDVFVPLHERAQIANRSGADLFISIHCNYISRSSITGTETYVMGLHTAQHNLEVAKRENAVILLEDDYEANYDFDPNSPEGHIMLSMFQNVFLEQSILFAEQVERQFGERHKRHSRGVKQAGFVVLKETAMPSVLIETGFLSNREEEGYLRSEAGQNQVAEAIRAAFGEYKLRLEGPAQLVSAPAEEKPQAKLSLDEDPFSQTSANGARKTGLSYCVQLAASPTPLNTGSGKWKDLRFPVETLREEGMYRYQARHFVTLEDARGAQNYFRKKGFSDAFVVAYRNGKKVPLSEVR